MHNPLIIHLFKARLYGTGREYKIINTLSLPLCQETEWMVQAKPSIPTKDPALPQYLHAVHGWDSWRATAHSDSSPAELTTAETQHLLIELKALEANTSSEDRRALCKVTKDTADQIGPKCLRVVFSNWLAMTHSYQFIKCDPPHQFTTLKTIKWGQAWSNLLRRQR
jgi:hypothetical protein